MTGWMSADVVLYIVAAYLATGGFLKLIAARRASLLAELERDIAKEQQQQQAAKSAAT
jgi:hypothetical protein